MKNIITATCGHIDHGKTHLVERLTGKNTMHTKDELKRSITIDLGYAQTNIDDLNLSIIDVPGHIDYLKNTLCGLVNADMAILVIAANEGVSNQTLLHHRAVELLNFKYMIVAITKMDLSSEMQKKSTLKQAESLISSSKVKNIKLCPVDYENKDSIENLKDAILAFSKKINPDTKKYIRINLDNSFSVKGAGTVVSGNLLSGSLEKNSKIYLYPGEKELKIRTIQSANKDIEKISARTRVALNVPNIKKDEAKRGNVITDLKNFKPSKKLDCLIKTSNYLKFDIKNYSDVKIFTGTSCVNAKIVNTKKEIIKKDKTCFVKLILKDEIPCFVNDKIIISDSGLNFIIAGGYIINSLAKRKTFYDIFSLNLNLNQMIIYHIIHERGFVEKKELEIFSCMEDKKIKSTVEFLKSANMILEINNFMVEVNFFKKTVQKIKNFIDFQSRNSFRDKNLPFSLIFSNFSYIPKQIISKAIESAGYKTSASMVIFEKDKKIPEKYKKMIDFIENSPSPVKISEITDKNDENLKILFTILRPYFIKLNEEYICSKNCIQKYINFIKEHFSKNDKLYIQDLKENFALNRKQTMSILEYTDTEKITKRFENYRIKSYNSKD